MIDENTICKSVGLGFWVMIIGGITTAVLITLNVQENYSLIPFIGGLILEASLCIMGLIWYIRNVRALIIQHGRRVL